MYVFWGLFTADNACKPGWTNKTLMRWCAASTAPKKAGHTSMKYLDSLLTAVQQRFWYTQTTLIPSATVTNYPTKSKNTDTRITQPSTRSGHESKARVGWLLSRHSPRAAGVLTQTWSMSDGANKIRNIRDVDSTCTVKTSDTSMAQWLFKNKNQNKPNHQSVTQTISRSRLRRHICFRCHCVSCPPVHRLLRVEFRTMSPVDDHETIGS